MPGNVADIILQILADWGVKNIYGVSGDAIFPLLDAISHQNRIKYYTCAMEAGAAFMASYEAKLTDQPAVCISTSGPGAVNLANGFADAYFEHAPVIAITGQVATNMLGSNAKQYFNQQQLFKTFCSSSELVTNPQSVVPLLSAALETAVNEKAPAHLSIPKDIFQMPVNQTNWPQLSGKSYTMGSGFAGKLDQAANQLNNAQRPLLIIGERNREIKELSTSLAQKIGAGIIIAQQAKGVIPNDHPLVLGGIGEGYIPTLLGKADIFLMVGEASFELQFLPSDVPLIQFAKRPAALQYNRTNIGIIGNPAQLLKLCTEKIRPKKVSSWGEEIINEKLSLSQLLTTDTQNNQLPIHPARLTAALNKTVAPDAIVALDIGGFIHWFDRGFQAHEQTILISSHWRSMGSAIPAAISAKINYPKKEVLALVGDGGFLMSMGELLTAVKYSLPITVVVANNHQYSLEKHKMQAMGMDSTGNDILVPDFAGFAKAAGASGIKVDNPAQLEAVLDEALNSRKPTVVDVQLADIPLPNLQPQSDKYLTH